MDGGKEITERALTHARKLLSDCLEPKLDQAKDEALLTYITKRKAKIPASNAHNQSH